MALFLREAEIGRLLDMPATIQAVEEALREQGRDQASNQPRRRIYVPGGALHVMAAGLPGRGVMGLKAYTTVRGRARFVVLLFSAVGGELLAALEADELGRLRTGAASGVATKYLARPDAQVVGIFGTGYQARTQAQAMCAVRPVREVRVYGRDAERRRRFCQELEGVLQCEVRSADSPEHVVRGADVLITITASKEPVFDGRLLEPGQHLNVAGSNQLQKREVDDETIRRASRIVVDQIEDAKVESGDLVGPVERGLVRWEQMCDLGAVVAGRAPGRVRPEEITLFKSNGLALEDVATACTVFERARANGVGTEFSFAA